MLSMMRMRAVGVREWSCTLLRRVARVGANRLAIEIEDTTAFSSFLRNTTVEVHLPLGGCFIAKIEVCADHYFLLTVEEYLDPLHCQDDIQRFEIQG